MFARCEAEARLLDQEYPLRAGLGVDIAPMSRRGLRRVVPDRGTPWDRGMDRGHRKDPDAEIYLQSIA